MDMEPVGKAISTLDRIHRCGDINYDDYTLITDAIIELINMTKRYEEFMSKLREVLLNGEN